MTTNRRPWCPTCERFLVTTTVQWTGPTCRRCGDRVTMRMIDRVTKGTK